MEAPRPRPRAHGLAVELTGQCNQGCGYCFNAWRGDGVRSPPGLPPEELRSLLSRALDEVDFRAVTFSGGEPLTRPDLFDLVDLVKARGPRVHVVSNGALVTDAIADRLAARRPISVQITLNGPTAALHDALVDARSFERTLEGIRRLLARGVAVTGTIVVTRRNAHAVGETLEVFHALGVREIGLSRFSPAGYSAAHVAELLPSRADVLGALAAAERFASARAEASVALLLPVPSCVARPEEHPHLSFGSCPVGTPLQELALGPDGGLRHCLLHPAAFVPDMRTSSFAEALVAPAVTGYRDVTPAFCAPCAERDTCGGGCGAAASSVFGEARALDPFVAQEVDPAFRERLRASRGEVLPTTALVRKGDRRRALAGALASVAIAACDKPAAPVSAPIEPPRPPPVDASAPPPPPPPPPALDASAPPAPADLDAGARDAGDAAAPGRVAGRDAGVRPPTVAPSGKKKPPYQGCPTMQSVE